MTTVSGIIRDTQGNALAGVQVSLRYRKPLVGYLGGAALQNTRLFTADGSGEVVMPDLVAGHYDVEFAAPPTSASATPVIILRGKGTVLDDGPQTLQSFLDSDIGEITPSILQQAQQAVIDAGDASRLQIGTVTTVAAGDPADATITGDPGEQILDLTIPQGADGADGADGQGVPVGGGAGQVLAKVSNDDFDTAWIASPAPPELTPTQVTNPDSTDFGAVSGGTLLISGNTTTRQTVQSGPVDVDGRADFLDAGTGLQVVSDASAPLNITFGDGFSRGQQRNYGLELETALSWDSLPDNEDAVFLFIRVLPAGTVETFHSLLPPDYAQARPSAPATGQTFYPTDHRHRMEVWDGAEWNRDNLIICVGECATSAGAVVSVVSYAFGGAAITTPQQGPGSGTTDLSFAANIGAPLLIDAFILTLRSAQGGHSAGDQFHWGAGGSDGSNNTHLQHRIRNNSVLLMFRSASVTLQSIASSTGGNINSNNFDFHHVVRRSF